MEIGPVESLESEVDEGVGENSVEKGRDGIAGSEPVLCELWQRDGCGGHDHARCNAATDDRKGIQGRSKTGVFDGETEAREKPNGDEKARVGGFAPDFEQVKKGKSSACQSDVVVGAGAVNAGKGRKEYKACSGDSCPGLTDPTGICEHQPGECEEGSAVYSGCGCVATKGEGREEQHLQALRHVAVHIREAGIEALVAKVVGDKAKMIGHPVGALFGGEAVGEVDDGVEGEGCAEQPQCLAREAGQGRTGNGAEEPQKPEGESKG